MKYQICFLSYLIIIIDKFQVFTFISAFYNDQGTFEAQWSHLQIIPSCSILQFVLTRFNELYVL